MKGCIWNESQMGYLSLAGNCAPAGVELGGLRPSDNWINLHSIRDECGNQRIDDHCHAGRQHCYNPDDQYGSSCHANRKQHYIDRHIRHWCAEVRDNLYLAGPVAGVRATSTGWQLLLAGLSAMQPRHDDSELEWCRSDRQPRLPDRETEWGLCDC